MSAITETLDTLPGDTARRPARRRLVGRLRGLTGTRGVRPRINPVLRRELRVRMRGKRAFVVLGVFLLVLGLATYALERVVVTTGSGSIQSFQVGQIVFAGLALLEIGLLGLVAPALTATTISAERERGTFDLLQATPLRGSSIVLGKLVAALGYAALLIVASIPMAGVVFLYGGVAPADVWATFALLGATTIAFGMVGLFFSALARRTALAVALAYTTVGVLVAGTLGAYVFLDAVEGGLSDSVQFAGQGEVMVAGNGEALPGGANAPTLPERPPRWLLALNPVAAMATLVADAIDDSPPDPFSGQPGGIAVFGEQFGFFSSDGNAGLAFDMNGNPIRVQETDQRPLWHITVALYLGLAVVLFVLTSWLVGRVGVRRRRRWGLPGRAGPASA
ncbi:MAG: hypothetical protein AVDCRST_MAG73-428 [uncultured Thermomicrobiales bacterium]|uniref:ABC-type transport system involved in multi-copper enzyme maturation, permease component n=1 Tax=uncultured Thermomicrobiales bacterium TaxID=1645740 RepID=A0A6J4TKW1_9BACT|nr:MAG: hypothetical protein AVDCRST_MAG73-428 [uncultured Thermomicrobiales bacterium]